MVPILQCFSAYFIDNSQWVNADVALMIIAHDKENCNEHTEGDQQESQPA